MASSAKPTPKVIRLSYNFSEWKVTSSPEKIHLKEGETIEFACSEGQVHLLLEPPDAYQPSHFQAGDPPVLVKRVAYGGMFWCGGTFHHGSQTITINPSDKKYGLNPNPGPDPGVNG